MKKLFIILVPVILLISYIYVVPSSNKNNNSSAYTYYVERVVDGDTFQIKFNGKLEKVRLIGVDTPETVNPNVPKEYFGKEASDFTKKMISKKNVRLEFDVQQRDKYGRLLCYVYLEDGRMLNEILLEEGYASVMTVPPNVKYSKRFLKLQQDSRNNKKGLWK
jgi:micrococcal nuclease